MLPRRKPASRGPMPRPNSEAETLHERAASRWPNSWIIIASAANAMREITKDISLQPSRRSSLKTYADKDFQAYRGFLEETEAEVTKIVTQKQPNSGVRFTAT